MSIIPVILSGGSGSRLWPLSREKTPKQFLKLMNDLTLLQRTVSRTQNIFKGQETEIVTVTLHTMYDETVRQLKQISPVSARHVLLEPEARNTAAAVALAINYVAENFGEESFIWILPADHHIADDEALKAAVWNAHEAASKDYLVTFGIQPTRPETGYGYIRKGSDVPGTKSRTVLQFVEKPDRAKAETLVASKEYLWSSGMHLFRARTARDNFKKFAPESWDLVERAVSKPNSCKKPCKILYSKINKEPFETAVAEKCSQLAVVPCNPGWSDIGCWESLWEIKNKDSNGNAITGQVFCEETKDSMVISNNRLVGCVGLKDVIIVETHDSVLVADKKANGSLKNLVQVLQKNNRVETISSPVIHHDWGCEHIMAETEDTRISELSLKPNLVISGEIEGPVMQLTAVKGQGQLIVDGIRKNISESETVSLMQDSIYSIQNMSEEPLKILAVQLKKIPFEQSEFFSRFWDMEPSHSHLIT